MNNIKVNLSIKDLENFTGIKAHTIRMWEKRYDLLQPNRTDTNIRTYNLASLQKLLNISYLNCNGLKISKIAKLKDDDIPKKVQEIASHSKVESNAINTLKISMLNFDQALFNKAYNQLLENMSFTEIFYLVFLPLLNEIGLLWQTNTITPAHEHFMFINIKQKTLINIENLQQENLITSSKTIILFLPENEIHDLGLLFINYQLIKKGYQTIFLGESVPMTSLTNLLSLFDDITFITYFTVYPLPNKIPEYIEKFNRLLLQGEGTDLLILGRQLANVSLKNTSEKVHIFNSIENLVKEL